MTWQDEDARKSWELVIDYKRVNLAQPWTIDEISEAYELRREGERFQTIAKALGRTREEVITAIGEPCDAST